MLKKIVISLGIVTLSFCTTTLASENDVLSGYYPDAAIISDIDEELDKVILEDANGMMFSFYGVSDWFVGDFVALIMHDNGTDSDISDDVIVDVNYPGYWDTKILEYIVDWEASENGLLLTFEDGTEYFVEG